jgi:soluble lytic murein transglycosylase-like protein
VPVSGSALPGQYRELLPHVWRAAERHDVSPALLLAIIDRETGDPDRIGFGGRNPSITNGNDFGLMQINRAAHPAFFRHHDWRDPAQNVDYGASVIAENLERYRGDVATAAAAYNAGPTAVDEALAAGRSADSVTTGGDYGSDVRRRLRHFRALLGR